MWENIIWAVFFGVPIAAGWVAVSLTPADFTIARVCFTAAALVVMGHISWWISIEHSFENKILIIISMSLAFLFIGACLGGGLYWIANREKTATQNEDQKKIQPYKLGIRSAIIAEHSGDLTFRSGSGTMI